METWIKKTVIVIVILCLLSPIGILLTWNYGDAWGEWSEVKVGNETWEPKSYSGGAPLADYDVPGWEDQFMASLGYIISAFVGVFMVILMSLGVAKLGEIYNEIRGKNTEDDRSDRD